MQTCKPLEPTQGNVYMYVKRPPRGECECRYNPRRASRLRAQSSPCCSAFCLDV